MGIGGARCSGCSTPWVGGLLDGEKLLRERGDPVGDRLLCDTCRAWSPMVRDLSEGVDGFADFREAYRLFRDS